MEYFAIVASLILFMALFFQILSLNKTKNLSLRFIVWKFRSRILFNIIYRYLFSHFNLIKKIDLNSGFSIGKFRSGNLFNINFNIFLLPKKK